MEEMKCTYDAFAFSPRAELLRRIFCLLAHPLMLIVPPVALAAALTVPKVPEAVATAFFLGFSQILIRAFRGSVLAALDRLARRDAKALRLHHPERYTAIRRRIISGADD